VLRQRPLIPHRQYDNTASGNRSAVFFIVRCLPVCHPVSLPSLTPEAQKSRFSG
jgi:hypothetical protein